LTVNKIAVIISKEWTEVFKNRVVIFTILVVPLVFTLLPLVTIRALDRLAGIGDAVALPGPIARVCGSATGIECIQIYLVNQFTILFLMSPLVIPVAIAAYGIVGEKITRSLEPLLATPITTLELFVGKSLAALIPAILATWLGYGVFVIGARVSTTSEALFARVVSPVALLTIGLVGPEMALAGVNLTAIVSSRVSDPRTAEQVSIVLILPLLALFFAQVGGVILIDTRLLLLVAGMLALLDVALILVGARVFRRETILTRWS
jgi:ABC-2 type transport system permease protein